jgi:hypothetical protein
MFDALRAFNNKTEVIVNHKTITLPKIKLVKNSLLTKRVRKIIADPDSYTNSVFITYDTILCFLDYYLTHKVIKEGKLNPQRVKDIQTTKENLIIEFENDIRIICRFQEHFTKYFFTLLKDKRMLEWVIRDEEGMSYEYETMNTLLNS